MIAYVITDENRNILGNIYNKNDIVRMFPNISFGADFKSLPELNIYGVKFDIKPTVTNFITEKTEKIDLEFDEDEGVFVQKYTIVNKSPGEVLNSIQTLINQHTIAVQNYMDDFARTRNYDDMKAAVTYLNCGVQRLEEDATYCSQMRAQIWETLRLLLADVQAGIREMPIDSQDVIKELPVLEWPNIEE